MRRERYLVTTELNGATIQKIWDSRHSLRIGHPHSWELELTKEGIVVNKLIESFTPSNQKAPIAKTYLIPNSHLSQKVRVRYSRRRRGMGGTATTTEPDAVDLSSISTLTLTPAKTLTPLFAARRPDATRTIDLAAKMRTHDEIFVITRMGDWVVTTEPMEAGRIQSGYIGYLSGRAVFQVRNNGKRSYSLQSYQTPLVVKLEEKEYRLEAHQSAPIPDDKIRKMEIQIGPCSWHFTRTSTFQFAGGVKSIEIDPNTQYFNKVRNIIISAFVLASIGLQMMPPPKPVEQLPDQKVKIDFERAKVLVQIKPTPVPTPPPTAKPTPQPTVKPTPQPTARPTPRPTPQPKITPAPRPTAPPKRLEPPKPVAKTPPPPPKRTPVKEPPRQARAPQPVPKAQIPAPAPPAPPTPPAAAKSAANALAFLGGGAKKPGPIVPKPGEYKNADLAANYNPNSVAPKIAVGGGALRNLANAGAGSAGAIDTKGSGAVVTGGAVSKGDLQAGGKSLNDVYGKASNAEVYSGGAGKGTMFVNSNQISVAGSLTADQIKKALEPYLNRIRFCYEKALLANPSAAGNVTYGWTVDSSGRASGVRPVKSTINDKGMHLCVAGIISKVPFPRPTGGPAEVEYPFNFSASSF